MNSNFFTAIHRNITENKEKVFLQWEANGRKVGYRGEDINHRVALVWQNLDKQEVETGDRILIAMPFSPEFVCTLLGIISYGATPVLPPALATQKDLLDLVEVAEIEAVCFKSSGLLTSLFAKLANVKNVTTDLGDYRIHRYIPKMVEGDQPALISYTAGSSGKPRAVAVTHDYLQNHYNILKQNIPGPVHKDLPLFPNQVLHNMAAGITTYIPSIPSMDLSQLDAEKIFWQLEEERIDSMSGTVHYFTELISFMHMHQLLLREVKQVTITGSPVPEYLPHHLKTFLPNAIIHIVYSTSQAEPITVRKVGEQKDPALGYYLGTVNPEIEIRVEGSDKINAGNKTQSAGHIQIKGRHVVQEEELKEKLEWLDTGDYGYLDDNGELYLTGRQGNESLQQGYSHYQIENVISSLPQVKKVAALGDNNREHFHVFYEGSIEPEKIREVLKNFPDSLIYSIQPVEKIPVDRRFHSRIQYNKLYARIPSV